MTQTLIQPPKTMLEVWESLPEGTLCQLINNKLILSPTPTNIHHVVLNEIIIETSLLLRKKRIGEIRIAPFDVHFSNQNILQPDLLFIKTENLSRIEDKGLVGAPDVVIEVLSPSTSQLDYDDKKIIYERFGVGEYFIVDPSSKSVDFFFLKNGNYEQQEKVNGQIISNILETTIRF